MKITKVELTNFKLFQTLTFVPGKTNLFRGINVDNGSSNASGKTTASLEAMMFVLYGKSEINLKDLVTMGKPSCKASVTFEHQSKTIEITREYPTKLRILVDGIPEEFVSASKSQVFIDDIFGTYDDFRKFRTLDATKGINILDLGNTSLKTTLMSFVEGDCEAIRNNLKEQKLLRETYRIENRMSPNYYSVKRLNTLQEGIEDYKLDEQELRGVIRQEEYSLATIRASKNTAQKEIEKLNRELVVLSQPIKICYACKQEIKQDKIEGVQSTYETLIQTLKAEITLHESDIIEAEDYLKKLQEGYLFVQHRVMDLTEKKNLLKASEKTQQYKYTSLDVYRYNEAIKKLDDFYLYYINNWLEGLEYIINNSLEPLNLQVSFVQDKRFLVLKDGEKEFSYGQLSSGQKTFLNIVFKLAILLYKGLDGIVIIDEGIDSLDTTNIQRLIEIFNSLPFQVFLISQHQQIEHGVQVFKFKRHNNTSMLVTL